PPCLRIPVVKFDQLENVDSARRSFASFPSVQGSGSGSSHPNSSKKPVFAHIRALFRRPFAQNVDSGQFPKPSNFQTLNLPTVLGTSHQNSQKSPDIPPIPPNPTCSSHQKADCFPPNLPLGDFFILSTGTSVIRGCAAVSL